MKHEDEKELIIMLNKLQDYLRENGWRANLDICPGELHVMSILEPYPYEWIDGSTHTAWKARALKSAMTLSETIEKTIARSMEIEESEKKLEKDS